MQPANRRVSGLPLRAFFFKKKARRASHLRGLRREVEVKRDAAREPARQRTPAPSIFFQKKSSESKPPAWLASGSRSEAGCSPRTGASADSRSEHFFSKKKLGEQATCVACVGKSK